MTSPAEALSRLRGAAAQDGVPDARRRQALLEALRATLLRRADDVVAALEADFAPRGPVEVMVAELRVTLDAARHARANLRRWMQPRRVPVPVHFQPARARVEPVPKGVVGIMAPWNYPVQLALLPAIDALAAGNRVAVKPSEATPATAALLADLLPSALGADVAQVCLGGPDVAADFAAQPWDHLVFTGGTATGRKVAEAAARNLTPVTLELGGKCPALVLPGADLGRAARDILVGKAINAGQTCVAPDTVLLVGHSLPDFLAACRAAGVALPEAAVVNDRQLARLEALCAGATLTPLGDSPGGRHRALALAEAPSEHPLFQEEVFGPVLPVQPCTGLDQALAWVAARPAPLAVYLFGASAEEEAVVAAATRSGAIVSGRAVEFAAMPALPFGGVGASGFGRRNGEAGFTEFSTLRARVRHGRWSLSRLLDPPRAEGALALARRLLR